VLLNSIYAPPAARIAEEWVPDTSWHGMHRWGKIAVGINAVYVAVLAVFALGQLLVAPGRFMTSLLILMLGLPAMLGIAGLWPARHLHWVRLLSLLANLACALLMSWLAATALLHATDEERVSIPILFVALALVPASVLLAQAAVLFRRD
jgi:hypothetical protein